MTTAALLDVKLRMEKIGYNSQELSFTPNHAEPDLCPVRVVLCIYRRAQLLHTPAKEPLTQFHDEPNRILIHSSIIDACLWSLANICYNITEKAELDKFTSHSIRVRAYISLNIAGKSTNFIKAALRWESNAFQMYLWNVIALTEQHSAAISACDPDGS